MTQRPALRSVAVFCGSNFGTSAAYAEAARALGAELAVRGLTLVYGGTGKGLMGVLADAALDAVGKVVGVINQRLFDRGHLHPKLTATHEVARRHARAQGTHDATRRCVRRAAGRARHARGTARGADAHAARRPRETLRRAERARFYEPLSALLAHATQEGFMKVEHRDLLVQEADPARLLDAFAVWTPPAVTKWIGQARLLNPFACDPETKERTR